MRRLSFALFALPLAVSPLRGADSDYRTPETAITAKLAVTPPAPAAGPAAYLGVHAQPDATGKLMVGEVQADSPAAKAGVKAGDLVTKVDGKAVASADAFKTALHAKSPGNTVQLSLTRAGKAIELTATLTALSHPMSTGRPPQPTSLGVQVTAAKQGEGVTIETVVPGSVADKAKLKTGETILKIDDTSLTGPDKLREVLSTKKPDDTLTLTLLLAEKKVEMKVKLEPPSAPNRRVGGFGGGWNRGPRYWTKPGYKLAIILVEYPDVKHNKEIPPEAWEKAMFSRGGTYKKTATGQEAFGSMYDYYFEQSYGQLKIEGKAFPYVEVSKKREEYGAPGTSRTALLTEALDKIEARDGKDALKDFDGVFYIFAGGRVANAPRGGLYWPHRASVQHNGKNWPYFICPEGGQRMNNISVFCHEFGHMLGLPDLYARPENPGMEGLDVWCAMSNQVGNGKPQHFSAWCLEKLNWIKPAVVDPTVKQKIALAPIESSPKECVKILCRPDGSEYFLLEYRDKKGFDASLPAHGLLIWRVVNNRPILEEAHGVEGPVGPRVFREYVPFPNDANRSFTPFTTPSSRSQLGGGLPVWITNIEKLPNGKIGFSLGYEYQ